MSYYRIFVGTLGRQGRLIEWNYAPKQGRLTQNKQICYAPGFSFIVASPLNNFLYWAGKISDERSAIYSVRVSPTDTYETLSRIELDSSNISHLQTDHAGTYLFISCYDKGLVCVYELLPDGRIGRCLDTKTFRVADRFKSAKKPPIPTLYFCLPTVKQQRFVILALISYLYFVLTKKQGSYLSHINGMPNRGWGPAMQLFLLMAVGFAS